MSNEERLQAVMWREEEAGKGVARGEERGREKGEREAGRKGREDRGREERRGEGKVEVVKKRGRGGKDNGSDNAAENGTDTDGNDIADGGDDDECELQRCIRDDDAGDYVYANQNSCDIYETKCFSLEWRRH